MIADIEGTENVFGNLVAILTDFANDYGISIKGKFELCNKAKNFNDKITIVREVDLFTNEPF